MANIVVVGAGMGGLSAAMLLALDGHDVTVVERDGASPGSDHRDNWENWERRGVNQFRQLHLMLPLWRHLLERELPTVATQLDEAGALRFNMIDALPDEVTGPPMDGDDRFTFLTGKRPFLEGVLANAASETFGVEIRRGVAIPGLLSEPGTGGVPRVIGVATEGGEEIRADLVVDAAGRRSALPDWLAAIGARRPLEEKEDCGFVYYGRHFRSGDGSLPRLVSSMLVSHDSVSTLVLPAEGGTWGVGVITSARDHAVRRLSQVETWDRVAGRFPHLAGWVDAEPITDVHVMAKIEDRCRRFVVDGSPVATGVLAVGDSWACTNPSLGRGASVGLLHACTLRDLLREVPISDGTTLATRWDAATEEVVAPMYRSTLSFDRHRLAEIDAQIAGVPYETDDPSWAITKAMMAGVMQDPVVLRGFSAIMSLLASPDEVLAEPGMLERVLAHHADGGGARPVASPDRQELVEICAGVRV
jgi:2-polyprenyl-6-methoxyphenol hydroxylase-like FAD-dependent oxidoreductase